MQKKIVGGFAQVESGAGAAHQGLTWSAGINTNEPQHQSCHARCRHCIVASRDHQHRMNTPSQALSVMPTAAPPAETPAAGQPVETASTAAAAAAAETVRARLLVAMHRPRSVLTARASILEACKRPLFAAEALYQKPVGRTLIEGFSIRFAEEALRAWRNVDVSAKTLWEDEERRMVQITVTDLEANLSYADDVLLSKVVERSQVREGQEVVGERTNSRGQKTYLVRATEDELMVKLNAAKSKIIRNSGLRLIPQDILEEAKQVLAQTRRQGGEDPLSTAKKLADAFSQIGIPPSELEAYLGHPLTYIQPSELDTLRGIYTAIRDGEAKWSDYRQTTPTTTPTSAPETKHAPAETLIPDTPEQTPQQRLAELCQKHEITFDELQKWMVHSQFHPKADSLAGFDDVPLVVAKRLLRLFQSRDLAAEIKGDIIP